MLQPALIVEVTDLTGTLRTLQICVGDITDTGSSGPVDLIAISCFPDDYLPTATSLVGQLRRNGVDVGHLAQHKARDERQRWQTWVSQPIGDESSFGRLICFEYGRDRDPSVVVGNVFRAVSEFVLDSGQPEVGVLRLPLLGTGDQGADKSKMLEALVHQAYTHLRGSLPVKTVQIVVHDQQKALHSLLVEAGSRIEQVKNSWTKNRLAAAPEYDYFVSYRRPDRPFVEGLVDALRARNSSLKVFIDQDPAALGHGFFWKPEIVRGIYNARRFLCVITDTYADSGECVDEFHMALCCGRHRTGFLRPLLRLNARQIETLPLIFRQINLINATFPPGDINTVLDKVMAP